MRRSQGEAETEKRREWNNLRREKKRTEELCGLWFNTKMCEIRSEKIRRKMTDNYKIEKQSA
jgi:hypothetical protein